MIWHEPILFKDAAHKPTLSQAKLECTQLSPSGLWAIPTESEMYYFWKANGKKIVPMSNFSSISLLINIANESEIESYTLKPNKQFVINCVARTKTAPTHGYTQEDISLSEWNNYQLQKL